MATALLRLVGPARRLDAAIRDALGTLGYVPDGTVEAQLHDDADGVWLRIDLPLLAAHALAARLARPGRPARLVTVVQPVLDACDVDLADDLVDPAGSRTPTPGSVVRELAALHGDSWGEICDDKPYFLVDAVCDAVIDPDDERPPARTVSYAPPPLLGDPKLDALALQLRAGAGAEVTEVEGRPCVRVRTLDGATVTTFLPADAIARLRAVLPGLG